MQNAVDLVQSTENAKGFYPTPYDVAEDLLKGVDWRAVSSILEPSAGKGDLASAVVEIKPNDQYGSKQERMGMVDCIEVDPYLRHILAGEGWRVIHDDFLTFKTHKKYDLIVMNPPFDKGAQHLSHAIQLLRGNGGMVRCILNAETLRNPYTRERQALLKTLNELGAELRYRTKAFSEAERSTDVEVVFVHAEVPADDRPSILLEGLKKAQELEREQENAPTEIAKDDFIDAIVDRFNFEMRAGLVLLDEYDAMKPYILRDMQSGRDRPIIELIINDDNWRPIAEREQKSNYIEQTRFKYWKALFGDKRFIGNMTNNLQEELHSQLEMLKQYDFTRYNILEIQTQMANTMVAGVERTIMDLFDAWTNKYNYSEYRGSVLHFDGWKTNDAFKVNKRVIHPMRDRRGSAAAWSFIGKYEPTGMDVKEILDDIEKVFTYLDTRDTPRIDMHQALAKAEVDRQTRNVRLTYFSVTFYLKGTVHITFHDDEILHKFNLYGCQRKGWLPPSYGKKEYSDMTAEEKQVIDAFEGEASYTKTMDNSSFYLSGSQQLMLEGGNI